MLRSRLIKRRRLRLSNKQKNVEGSGFDTPSWWVCLTMATSKVKLPIAFPDSKKVNNRDLPPFISIFLKKKKKPSHRYNFIWLNDIITYMYNDTPQPN